MLPLSRFPYLATARVSGDTSRVSVQLPSLELARVAVQRWLDEGYHSGAIHTYGPHGRAVEHEHSHRGPRRGDRIVGIGGSRWNDEAGEARYGEITRGLVAEVDPATGDCVLDTGARVHFVQFDATMPGGDRHVLAEGAPVRARRAFTVAEIAAMLGVSESRTRGLVGAIGSDHGYDARQVLDLVVRHLGLDQDW